MYKLSEVFHFSRHWFWVNLVDKDRIIVDILSKYWFSLFPSQLLLPHCWLIYQTGTFLYSLYFSSCNGTAIMIEIHYFHYLKMIASKKVEKLCWVKVKSWPQPIFYLCLQDKLIHNKLMKSCKVELTYW